MSITNRVKGWSNFIMAKTSRLAEIIRKRRVISFGELCSEGHIAPATLYGYRKILLARFKDIEYDGENFRVIIKHHRMPNGKEVAVEK